MATNGGPSRTPTSPPPPGLPSRSPPRVQHSRNASSASQSPGLQHRPSNPSALRQAELPPSSQDDRFHRLRFDESDIGESAHAPEFHRDGIQPHAHDFATTEIAPEDTRVQGEIEEPPEPPTAQSRLLDSGHKYLVPHNCGQYNCNHGAFSPRPRYRKDYGSISSSYAGPPPDDDVRSMRSFSEYGGMTPAEPASIDGILDRGYFGDRNLSEAVSAGLLGKKSQKSRTQWLARKYGVGDERLLYVSFSKAVPQAAPMTLEYYVILMYQQVSTVLYPEYKLGPTISCPIPRR